jgi:hypothetical protein
MIDLKCYSTILLDSLIEKVKSGTKDEKESAGELIEIIFEEIGINMKFDFYHKHGMHYFPTSKKIKENMAKSVINKSI